MQHLAKPQVEKTTPRKIKNNES